MDVDELMAVVRAEGLDSPVLYGNGRLRNDAVVLDHDGDSWRVYLIGERNRMWERTLRSFDSESAALEYVFVQLRQIAKAAESLDAFSERHALQRPGACTFCTSYWVSGVENPW